MGRTRAKEEEEMDGFDVQKLPVLKNREPTEVHGSGTLAVQRSRSSAGQGRTHCTGMGWAPAQCFQHSQRPGQLQGPAVPRCRSSLRRAVPNNGALKVAWTGFQVRCDSYIVPTG